MQKFQANPIIPATLSSPGVNSTFKIVTNFMGPYLSGMKIKKTQLHKARYFSEEICFGWGELGLCRYILAKMH